MMHHENYEPPESYKPILKIMSQHKREDMTKLLNSHKSYERSQRVGKKVLLTPIHHHLYAVILAHPH